MSEEKVEQLLATLERLEKAGTVFRRRMKELKFRAWDGKKMIEDVIPVSETSIIELFEYEWQETEVKSVEQYTGLKDKNGKEIYEGDVVNIQGIEYYVDFEHGGFWFNNDNRKWKANRPFTHFLEINDTEVVGNIHENPGLLGD